MLSDMQVEAIYKYVEDSYLSRYCTTKAIVYTAIGYLKTNKLSAKKPLSWHWFHIFIKEYSQLFQTLKIKAIAQVQITAIDIEVIKN